MGKFDDALNSQVETARATRAGNPAKVWRERLARRHWGYLNKSLRPWGRSLGCLVLASPLWLCRAAHHLVDDRLELQARLASDQRRPYEGRDPIVRDKLEKVFDSGAFPLGR